MLGVLSQASLEIIFGFSDVFLIAYRTRNFLNFITSCDVWDLIFVTEKKTRISLFCHLISLGVPICASECDDWFEACKNDSICVENVLTDYNFTMFGENLCPVDAMCKNYSEMYGNGKGLCEKMWGSSYKYTEQNANKDNCMVFWFTPGTENPNRRVQKEGTGSASRNAFSAMFLLVIQVYGLSF